MSERKIYPLTNEIIDRAEENTAQNLGKYLEEEKLRRELENMSDEETKAYCEKIADNDSQEAAYMKVLLEEGYTYRQIAFQYKIKNSTK